MKKKQQTKKNDPHRGIFVTALAMLAVALLALAVHIIGFPEQLIDLRDAFNHVIFFLLGVLGLHILDRLWVWKQFRASLSEEIAQAFASGDRMASKARECGVTAIYRNRKEAEKDVARSIEQAEERIWLLGISLTRSVVLNELLSLLQAKKKTGVKIRILLMDPLCSPAVFRTLLESKPETVAAIHSSLTTNTPLEPYKTGALYGDVNRTTSALEDPQVRTPPRLRQVHGAFRHLLDGGCRRRNVLSALFVRPRRVWQKQLNDRPISSGPEDRGQLENLSV